MTQNYRYKCTQKPTIMATAKIVYTGGLRTSATHLKSGTEIITDAPVDNNGKGEAFSPTDLVATAYVSCMLTIVGIYCEKNDVPFHHGEGEVNKIMESNPRRIGKLEINLDFSGNDWNEDLQKRVKRVAEACPVAKSVSEDMEVVINYKF